MPCSLARADNLLKKGKARVVSRCPFTIKMLEKTKEYKQEVVASLITSSSKVGVACKSDKEECLFASEVELRQDIPQKMERRRSYRRTRRGRKTRYRKCRFNNRKINRRFTPTLRSKIEGHEREQKRVEKLLPIKKWLVVRGAKVEGHFKDGSLEEQWLNTQRQVFERDGFKCRHCRKGKRELHAHHLEARKDGGLDALENLVTLCKECHTGFHQGLITLKIGKSNYKGKVDTEVAIIRKNLVVQKGEDLWGFQVKAKRNALSLPYSPLNDACAALNVLPSVNIYKIRGIPRGDYQRTKGARSQMEIPKGKIQGFKKFDKVKYQGQEYFIKGRRMTGYFELMTIDGEGVGLRPIPKAKQLARRGGRGSCLIALTTPLPHL